MEKDEFDNVFSGGETTLKLSPVVHVGAQGILCIDLTTSSGFCHFLTSRSRPSCLPYTMLSFNDHVTEGVAQQTNIYSLSKESKCIATSGFGTGTYLCIHIMLYWAPHTLPYGQTTRRSHRKDPGNVKPFCGEARNGRTFQQY